LATEPPPPSGSPQQISAAILEVSERAQLIVREEIELAKVEITQKLTKLARGAAIGAAAGVFALGGLLLLLHGLSWLAWWLLPVSNTQIFWGYFVVAALLFVVGGIAGVLAARLLRSGAPPKPEMAIQEAQRVKETVRP
jgi:hypothetical protein